MVRIPKAETVTIFNLRSMASFHQKRRENKILIMLEYFFPAFPPENDSLFALAFPQTPEAVMRSPNELEQENNNDNAQKK